MEPSISLNYLLSRVNMNDVRELDSVLETNKLKIETLNKELAFTQTEEEEEEKSLNLLQNTFLRQSNPWGCLCLHQYTKH